MNAAPLTRSPLYALRLLGGVSLALIGIGLLVVFENALLGLQEDVGTAQASWPQWVSTSVEIGIASSILIAIVTTNVFLLATRRFRRWALVNTAAGLGILLSTAGSQLVTTLATSNTLITSLREEGPEVSLGNAGLASLVAVFTLASPWIGRRLRPWVVGIFSAGIALSFLGGTHTVVTFPFDIGVGITAGAAVGLILKTRDRTPTQTEIAATLAANGVAAATVERASVDARGSVPWFVRTTDGTELFVKTLGSDQRAADLLFRLYRWFRLRRSGDRRPYASLERAVEHEALLSLAAQSRGVKTPRLLVVAEIGTDGALLCYERIRATPLAEIAGDEVSTSTLQQLWRLVAAMDRAGIAHRDLRLANVLVDEAGVAWLIDFGFAELAASRELRSRDVAELIASTAVAVGAERATAAALEVLGPEHIKEALPWIQPLGLSTATRTQIGRSRDFEKLRGVVSEAVGASDVAYVRMERINRRTIFLLLSLGLAAYVLLPQLAAASGFLTDLVHADPTWILLAAVASGLTYLGATIGVMGAVPVPMPFRKALGAQLASSFANRVTPAKVGGMATNVRFLQRRAVPATVAVSAIGLNTLAGFVVHASLLFAVTLLTGTTSDLNMPVPSRAMALTVVALAVAASGVVMLMPLGRRLLTRNLLPAIRSAWRAVAAVARSPLKLAELMAGSSLVTISYTMAMLASLRAVGATTPVASAALVYLAGSAVATAAPTPGGVGATEAALVAGYTAIGVASPVAFSAVLLFRLVTFWLPILPGWLALIRMQRNGDL